MSKKDYKIQYSKTLPLITGIIFIFCLYKGFAVNVANYTDLTIHVTSITTSAGLFGSAIIWSMKKSQSENNVKLRIEMYRVASKERFNYNKKMILLQQKYKISDEELCEIEDDSPMDEFEDSALSSIESSINDSQSESDSTIELQDY